MTMRAADLLGVCQRVLGDSQRYATEVSGVAHRLGVTRFADGRVHQAVETAGIEVAVRVVGRGRMGRASTTRGDRAGLRACVAQAEASLACAPRDRDVLPLPGPQRYPAVQTWCGATAAATAELRVEIVRAAVRACARARLRGSGVLSTTASGFAIANSRGLAVCQDVTEAVFAVTALGEGMSGWQETVHRDVRVLPWAAATARAIATARRSRSPRSLAPGRYPVILEPAAVAELLGCGGDQIFSARAVQEGRSPLTGKLGRRVCDPRLSLWDDAYHPAGLGLCFDGEGLPRRRVRLLERGRAVGLVHDRRTARAAGTRSTGHGLPEPHAEGPVPLNLVLEPGAGSLEDLVRDTARGVLVTRFHYTNVVDPGRVIVTGLTRDGTFWIEGGRVRWPIRNLRFTEQLMAALNRVAAVGRDQVFVQGFVGGGCVVPALALQDFAFTSAAGC